MVNAAIASLDGACSAWIDACRIPSADYPSPEQCHFPDRITELIDDERKQQFQLAGRHYRTLQTIIIGYMPPRPAEAKLANFMFEGGQSSAELTAEKALDTFKQKIVDLEDRLASAITLDRMQQVAAGNGTSHDELLGHLRYSFTGALTGVVAPPPGVFLDSTLNAQQIVTGLTPKVGDKFVTVVAIDGFPEASYAGILDILSQLPFPSRWSTRWIALDQQAALATLKKFRRQWSQRTRGLVDQLLHQEARQGSAVNADAIGMVADVDVASAVAESGEAAFGYFTACIILMHEDVKTALGQARVVRQAVIQQGFNARIEDVNTVEAFIGSLPGHLGENVRRPTMHTRHLANMLSLATTWTGAQACPNPLYPPGSPALITATTDGSTPFCLNLCVGDVGHTLVFGPTGAGKSTLLCLLAAQFRRYRNASVQVFDIGHSMEALTHAVDGHHYTVTGDDGSLSFAPLARLGEDVSWEAEYVETLMRLQGHRPTASERNEITRALRTMASSSQTGNMTTLEITLQAMHLKELIKPYTVNGSYGELLDAEAKPHEYDAPWQCFEVGELMNMDDKIRLPVLLHLFHEIECGLDGSPTLLILDEAWAMLGHEVFREKIREWLKTLRKRNVSVVMATQSLSDATGSGILDVLIESCPTNIFLPNPESRHGDSAALYQSLGLREGEIDTIAGATPKREYLIRSTLGSRLIDFRLGSIALTFCAVPPAELPTIRQMKAEQGGDWALHYLDEKGLRHAI